MLQEQVLPVVARKPEVAVVVMIRNVRIPSPRRRREDAIEALFPLIGQRRIKWFGFIGLERIIARESGALDASQ